MPNRKDLTRMKAYLANKVTAFNSAKHKDGLDGSEETLNTWYHVAYIDGIVGLFNEMLEMDPNNKYFIETEIGDENIVTLTLMKKGIRTNEDGSTQVYWDEANLWD